MFKHTAYTLLLALISLNDDHVLKSTTYSGKTAEPRWESSSSSMVKPLQLTCRQRKQDRGRRHKQTGEKGEMWSQRGHFHWCVSSILPVQKALWEPVHWGGHWCVSSRNDAALRYLPGSSRPSHCPSYLDLEEAVKHRHEKLGQTEGTARKHLDLCG